MADSSSSSSSATAPANGLNNLLSQAPPVASPSSQVAATPTPPPAAATPALSTTKSTDTAAIREDMIKPAVSFLSSPNVRSADREKKIAFLQKKGLTQAEITEAFKRAGVEGDSTVATTTTTTTTTNNIPATASQPQYQQQQHLAPVLPSRNVNYSAPQIVYYPQPPNPPVPVEKVFAMAVILGMGAVGVTAGVVGILRRLIAPIFNRIAEYQRTRYNQRKEIADRLLKSIKSYNTENDDLDALIDQGEEKTVADALVKHHSDMSSKIDKLLETSRERIAAAVKDKTYSNFRSELTSLRNVITSPSSDNTYSSYSPSHYMRNTSSDSPAVSGLKSDIRSLKAVLLNRRNFPTV
ncbi:peroxisomal membrane anchor family protein [Mucor ambiguus]|uniref:Peroxisomal membrane protein PEX14 n=1 Tax=Mucor ambiguus TaxID=91626 RepID=A0A0C9MUZ2_9FUNG|nr:peroxisomal membrane anchor family protein [Mucor ambiguus]